MNAPIPVPPIVIPRPAVKPPSVLLLGHVGGGKTYALSTLIEAGLELFVLVCEPNGLDSLLDAMWKRKLPMDKLHWRYIPPALNDWQAQLKIAEQIHIKDYESLTKSLPSQFGRDACNQFAEVLKCCQNFYCDRTQQFYGDITTWGPSRAFAIDSMTGLNDIIREHHLGHKPAPHQGEWGVIMFSELELIKTLCSQLQCYFVVTAHVDREKNEINPGESAQSGGATQLTMAALGSKNAPKIARLFSEIVLTKRSKDGAVWSTADPGYVLKNRALSFSDQLFPNFKIVYDAHQRRLDQAKQIEEALAQVAPATQK